MPRERPVLLPRLGQRHEVPRRYFGGKHVRGGADEAGAEEVAPSQNSPVMVPSSVTSMFSAAGCSGKPNMVRMLPA